MSRISVFSRLSFSLLGFVIFGGIGQAAELKHFWDFEGADFGQDRVGQAHGVVTETTSLETEAGAGGVGSAMKVGIFVSGGDDFLEVDSAQLYDPLTEAFSMSFWVRMPDDGTSDPRGIFDFSGNGGDGVQSLYIGTSGELAFRIDFPGSGFALAKVIAPLEDDEWHSVVATYDPAVGVELHLDGFGVDATAAAVPGSVTMAPSCYLGAFNFAAPSNRGLGGNLDDFAIYAGVLTEEEIRALSVREVPPISPIDTVSVLDGIMTITWDAPEGALFSVWQTPDLKAWAEIDDSVEAGSEGGSFSFPLPDPVPQRLYLQIRRPEE